MALRPFLVMLALLVAAPALSAPLEPLDIKTADGVKHFEVEVARSDADRERGLMFRRDLAPDRGMLFEFDKDDVVYFWMKNTYIPLDMIFCDKTGSVVSIAADAEPLSEPIISSKVPASKVVEFIAGTAARLNIKPGDTLVFPAPPR